MATIPKQLSDLLQNVFEQNSSNFVFSLLLAANNSFSAPHKDQIGSFEHSLFDSLDEENSSTSFLFHQPSSYYYVSNDTYSNGTTDTGVKPRTSTEIPIWLIPCYSIILIFAIVGNLLVASTLFQNRRMRTITNVFLANLAISDMLLGVLCMPITLAGTYLRHFIFGELVCKFIQFAQAVSVAVSSWTLVAISCERYYAICHPLRSRTWQTINHAYRIIACIWFGSIICMAPIAIFSQLIPTSREGFRKCREQWPKEAEGFERFYNIFLVLALLVLPLVILCVAYILITRTLYVDIQDEKNLILGYRNNSSGNSVSDDGKMYTQVMMEVNPPTVFHFNMSFRYHARKTATTGCCASNSRTLQVVQTTANSDRETEHLTTTGMIRKYSTKNNRRRGLCYRSAARTGAEAEISLPDSKEVVIQQTAPSSSQPHSNDAITLNGIGESDRAESAHSHKSIKTIPPAPTHQSTIHSLDAQFSKRRPPPKSVNHNRILTEANKQDNDDEPCVTLQATPTTLLNRSQYRHRSMNHKQLQLQLQQQDQLSQLAHQQQLTEFSEKRKLNSTPSLRIADSALRRSNHAKSLESKKRVVKMLFVLVLEFFICWTPLYVINTMAMLIGPAVYEYVDYTTISFFQLLAYTSSCCNPITYCFMNASFRRAFVDTFKDIHLKNGNFWHKKQKPATEVSIVGNSIALTNSCTVVTTNNVLDSPRL